MKGKSAVSVTELKKDCTVIHANIHSYKHIDADRCFNNDIIGAHLLFLHRAKRGWSRLPQYPQRPFLNSIYVIFWDHFANRNNFPPGLHLSAYVRHAELNA